MAASNRQAPHGNLESKEDHSGLVADDATLNKLLKDSERNDPLAQALSKARRSLEQAAQDKILADAIAESLSDEEKRLKQIADAENADLERALHESGQSEGYRIASLALRRAQAEREKFEREAKEADAAEALEAARQKALLEQQKLAAVEKAKADAERLQAEKLAADHAKAEAEKQAAIIILHQQQIATQKREQAAAQELAAKTRQLYSTAVELLDSSKLPDAVKSKKLAIISEHFAKNEVTQLQEQVDILRSDLATITAKQKAEQAAQAKKEKAEAAKLEMAEKIAADRAKRRTLYFFVGNENDPRKIAGVETTPQLQSDRTFINNHKIFDSSVQTRKI
jgi:fused signal recognition particle receptor